MSTEIDYNDVQSILKECISLRTKKPIEESKSVELISKFPFDVLRSSNPEIRKSACLLLFSYFHNFLLGLKRNRSDSCISPQLKVTAPFKLEDWILYLSVNPVNHNLNHAIKMHLVSRSVHAKTERHILTHLDSGVSNSQSSDPASLRCYGVDVSRVGELVRSPVVFSVLPDPLHQTIFADVSWCKKSLEKFHLEAKHLSNEILIEPNKDYDNKTANENTHVTEIGRCSISNFILASGPYSSNQKSYESSPEVGNNRKEPQQSSFGFFLIKRKTKLENIEEVSEQTPGKLITSCEELGLDLKPSNRPGLTKILDSSSKASTGPSESMRLHEAANKAFNLKSKHLDEASPKVNKIVRRDYRMKSVESKERAKSAAIAATVQNQERGDSRRNTKLKVASHQEIRTIRVLRSSSSSKQASHATTKDAVQTKITPASNSKASNGCHSPCQPRGELKSGKVASFSSSEDLPASHNGPRGGFSGALDSSASNAIPKLSFPFSRHVKATSVSPSSRSKPPLAAVH